VSVGNRGGRPPIPTHLKILRGNPGHRPIPDDEPQPEQKKPRCPSYIKGERRREWHRITRELLEMGVLALPDRVAIEKYTFWFMTWLKVSEEIERDGVTKIYKLEKTGYPMLDPRISLANTASDKIDRFLTEFGCTAASRTRIRIEKKKPLDAFEEFRRRKYLESKPTRS
jgi:P27 family predicted phage terminase small subunit